MTIDSPSSRHTWRFLSLLLAIVAGIALAISLGIARSAVAQTVPMDPDGFTAYIAKQFELALPDAKVRIKGPLYLSVTAPNGPNDAYLSTIYSACQRGGDTCPMQVETYVSQMAAFYRDTKSTVNRESLRVLVRPAIYADQLRQDTTAQGGPVVVPLSGGLWLVAASDEPTAIGMVTMQDLTKLGLSANAGIAIARQNMLDEMRHEIASVMPGDHQNIMGMTGDPYESSLFAFPELWAPLAASLGGNLLIAVPASDVVLCGDGAAPGMAASLTDAARSVMANANRPFSAAVFRWTPTGWQVLPSASAPPP